MDERQRELLRILEQGKPKFPWGEIIPPIIGIIVTIAVLTTILMAFR